MAIDASPGVAANARTYAELEARVLNAGDMEGVALRYGFFYGPGTWYHPDGASADQVRRQEVSVIGDGEGVWSWVHIEDAAIATVEALTAPPGVYHVVDDDPSPVAVWLPAFARFVGAPAPPRVTVEEARAAAGEDAVYYGRSSAVPRTRRRRGRSASSPVAWNGWTGEGRTRAGRIRQQYPLLLSRPPWGSKREHGPPRDERCAVGCN